MKNSEIRKIGRQRRYCSYNQYCLLVLLVPMLIFLFGAGALTTQAHTNISQFDSIEATPTTQHIYGLGETFQIGGLQYKITSVETINDDSDLLKSPRYGYTFLIISLTIENRRSADVEVRSTIGFNLENKTGQKQETSMGATLAVKHPIDGTIKAGGLVSGEIGYEVLKGVQTFQLSVIPDPLSLKANVAKVKLSL